jgi:N-acyl-D-aspartate/D-glutamate deacylase
VTPRIFTGDWARVTVKKMQNPALRRYEGRTVAEIAGERNADKVDTFIDLALEDDLNTWFTNELCNTDDARVGEMLNDPRISISLSDGGAHVDMLCDAGYATYLLGTWVRENRALSLEYAVRRLTSEIAEFWGMKDRGRLSVGMAADIAIFDPATVGSDRLPTEVADLPGGAVRLSSVPRGVHYTIVNGEILLENLKDSGRRPGRVLHSANA